MGASAPVEPATAAALPLYSALIVASLLWGSLPVASKALVGVISPGQQTLVRAVAAFVVLSVVSLLITGRAGFQAALRRPLDLVVQGLLSFFASSLTSLMSVQYIPAGLQAILVSTYPVMLAVGTFRETGLSGRMLLGTLVALVGIVAVVGGDDPTGLLASGADPRGVGLALLTALIIAGAQRWGQRQVRRGDPLGTTALAAGAAIPFALLFALGEEGVDEIATASLAALGLLLYIGVFCTAINFGLWFWGLKYVSAARAAPIQYLSTPASVLLAWFFLDERLTIGLVVGTALVLGGVFFSQSRRSGASGIKEP